LDCPINSHSCTIHKIYSDKIPFLVDHDAQLHLDLIDGYNFVMPKNHSAEINLFVTESVTTEINFFCGDYVDLTVRLIILFPRIADINISVTICGNNSKVTILSLCALAQQQSVIIKTKQVHCGKNSQSKLLLQGLISDQGRLTYDGIIRIEKDACATYALQNNKNILLSSKATAISIPNIEVLNHDVQCYHGAAIGKFDRQQMQYMQCRGLSELIIKQLLVQELFEQVLQGYEKREFILKTVYEKI
jgi:SUF system FeS cluster assembly, SufBD